MSLSQEQVRDLFTTNLAQAATRGRPNEVTYIYDAQAWFYYVAGATTTADGVSVLNATNGRWFKVPTGAAVTTIIQNCPNASDTSGGPGLFYMTATTAQTLNLAIANNWLVGDVVRAVDVGGNAATLNKTVTIPTGHTLNGVLNDTFVIDRNYASVDLQYFGSGKWIVVGAV